MRLQQNQIEQFEQDGILFFPALLSPAEMVGLREELPGILDLERPEILREKHSTRVRCAFAPHTYNERFRRLMHHPRIVEPVRQLLGGDVYLHQFSINPKAPFEGEAWGWHQDYPTWLEDNRILQSDLINVGVFLDEVTEFNGPLFFVQGSHTHGAFNTDVDEQSTSYKLLGMDNEKVAALCEQGKLYSPKGPAGSVWMFHCNMVHASNANISPHRRALCTLCYNRTNNLPTAYSRPEWEAHSDFTIVDSLEENCLI